MWRYFPPSAAMVCQQVRQFMEQGSTHFFKADSDQFRIQFDLRLWPKCPASGRAHASIPRHAHLASEDGITAFFQPLHRLLQHAMQRLAELFLVTHMIQKKEPVRLITERALLRFCLTC
jgi:hypothetical protein